MEEALQPRFLTETDLSPLPLGGEGPGVRGFLPLLLVSLCAGCVTTGPLPLPKWDAPPKGQVAQVMPLWADGIAVQSDPMQGGRPVPGLAARVYLFGPDLGQPLVADGTLIVYQYDDLQPPSDDQLPREVWTLDKASLEKLLKKDALGWGYNLWLPWSSYNPAIRKVGLVICYRPEKGMDAWSGQHILPLRGENPGPSAAGPKRPSSLQQARSDSPLNQFTNPKVPPPPVSARSTQRSGPTANQELIVRQ